MIKYYFGSPGSGKTTVAVYEALKNKKHYRHCVTNFDNSVPGVFVDKSTLQLGEFKYPTSTLLLLDEAGIQFNNRHYKQFPPNLISYFKLHRHYKNDIIIFSQSWEDVDITVRRLTDELWYLKKLGPFTMMRKVRKFVTVNESDYQIINGYQFCSPLWNFVPKIFGGHKTLKFVFRPRYYKYFDSFSDDANLPVKELKNDA